MKYIHGMSDDTTIRLFYRENDVVKERTITDFQWYFYITSKARDTLIQNIGGPSPEGKVRRQKWKDQYGITNIVKDGDYARVYMKRDYILLCELVKELETIYKIRTFEADVDLLKRYMLDNVVEIEDKYKLLSLDIETDDRNTKIEVGEMQILSCGGFDGEKEFWLCEDDERLLLEQIWDLIIQYDVIVGWNSAKFDIPYIQKRMEKYGIKKNWNLITHKDMMKRFQDTYKYYKGIKSYSLNSISTHFLNKTKIHLDKSIYELFKTDRATLKKYNLMDCQLVYEINAKLGLLDVLVSECKWCNVFLSRSWISELIDNFALGYAKRSGKHLFSKKFRKKYFTSTDEKKYAGGYVFTAKPGLFENVYVFDFKSLYPSIIRTWNISLETMTKNPDDAVKSIKPDIFFKNEPGILPEIVTYFLNERKKFQDEMKRLEAEGKEKSFEYSIALNNQSIVKELCNSVYGIIGNEYTRYFNIDLAECITLAGQHCIKFAASHFESQDQIVLGGDTDSLFVKIKEGCDTDLLLEGFHIALAEHLKKEYGIKQCFIEFRRDKYFKKFINLIKKNYVGLKEDGDKQELYATGIELIKKDTIEYARRLQKQVIEGHFYNNWDLETSMNFVKSEREKFLTAKVEFKDISTTRKISKPLDEYKSVGQHIRLAKRLWNMKEHFVGSDISYVIKDNKDKEQVISEDEFIGEFDRNYYWKNKIYSAIKRIMLVIYPDHDWNQYLYLSDEFKTKKRKKSLI